MRSRSRGARRSGRVGKTSNPNFPARPLLLLTEGADLIVTGSIAEREAPHSAPERTCTLNADPVDSQLFCEFFACFFTSYCNRAMFSYMERNKIVPQRR